MADVVTEKLLSDEEIKWIIQSYLSHPNRVGKGAKEEEILSVIKWAQELKKEALFNLEILEEIYLGNIVVDLRPSGEVVMMTKPENQDGAS